MSAAGSAPRFATKSVSAPGSISAMNSSAISAMRGFMLLTRLGRNAFIMMLRICPWRGGSSRSSGSRSRDRPWRVCRGRPSAGLRRAGGSRSWILCCAHSGSWCMTVDGSLASPMANPYWLREQLGMVADVTLVFPLRQHPQARRVSGRLVPRDRGGVALRCDRRVHDVGFPQENAASFDVGHCTAVSGTTASGPTAGPTAASRRRRGRTAAAPTARPGGRDPSRSGTRVSGSALRR